ncbi:MAG TPA: HD domain-containing protein [Candidatus Binataceae bacterium]
MKLTSRFADAFAFAFEVHREQTKKGGSIPYISHLLEVAGVVLSYGGNEDEAIAALLHDAVEDHPDVASFETIGKRFGTAVAAIVESCSDATVIPKPPWRPRKEKYIAHLGEADESVLMVAAADKLANARAVMKDYRVVGEEVWKRFNAGKDDQFWYYRTVTQALEDRAGNGRARELIEELKRAVAQLETLCGGASNSG